MPSEAYTSSHNAYALEAGLELSSGGMPKKLNSLSPRKPTDVTASATIVPPVLPGIEAGNASFAPAPLSFNDGVAGPGSFPGAQAPAATATVGGVLPPISV